MITKRFDRVVQFFKDDGKTLVWEVELPEKFTVEEWAHLVDHLKRNVFEVAVEEN